MKKLLLILLLLFSVYEIKSQTIDTSSSGYSLISRDNAKGKFNYLTNRGTFQGQSAGTVEFPLMFSISQIDTANWSFVSRDVARGKYTVVTNRATFYGKDAGTVEAILINDINAYPSFTNVTISGNISGDSIHTTYDSTVQQDVQNLNVNSATASTIAGFDANKNLVSLAVATYPSLTELAYVKGVTSAIQTQLDAKSPIASPTFTGTVTAPALTMTGLIGFKDTTIAVNGSGGATGSATCTAQVMLFNVTNQSTNDGNAFTLTITNSNVSSSTNVLGLTVKCQTDFTGKTFIPHVFSVSANTVVIKIFNGGGGWSDDFSVSFFITN